MSTSKKESGKITGETTGQITKKSGRGNSHGVISEVSAYLTVKPGHEEEARAASLRFGEVLKRADWKDVQKTGLRDARLVNFDNGRRLMFASGFETDWDPYVGFGSINEAIVAKHLKRSVSYYFLQNFYVTPSGMFTLPPFLNTLQMIGADRIMYAVDYPYIISYQARTFLENAPISPADKEKIAHGNAEKVLKI